MSTTPEMPPTLPRELLDQIGEYGQGHRDGASEVDRMHRWELLIGGIKDYARAHAAAAAASVPAGEVVVTKNELGQIVAVTRQDEGGRILSVIAESKPAAYDGATTHPEFGKSAEQIAQPVLTPGNVYPTRSHGAGTYVGVDMFHGQVTHEFRTRDGLRHSRPEDLHWFLAPQRAQAQTYHKSDTPERVCFYEQDFYVLSNFSAFNLEWEGMTFQTSEAAYHWEKFAVEHDDDTRNSIAYAIYEAPSAHAAFKIAEAQKEFRRTDWDEVKVDIMRNILRAKVAQHEYVRTKLLATGDRELVEDSWLDDFWGWGPNRDGQNMLGRLWMEIRAELRAAGTDGAPA